MNKNKPLRHLLAGLTCAGMIPVFAIISSPSAHAGDIAIAIHGGAGSALNPASDRSEENERIVVMRQSLEAGYAILQAGGSSLDAVEAAIIILEDSPLFNAGKGAVFTSEGKNELDASIMDGRTLGAGAVGGVTTIKNPIKAARAVMEKTWHVLLAGTGAEAFAKECGLEIVSPDYFRTEPQWKKYLDGKRGKPEPQGKTGARHLENAEANGHFGTVGAVALDREGNLAAGTSTGGLMHKKWGRIGDSPIAGAGNYAENATCAVSGTGQGEFFMRHVIAFDISARMKYKGVSLAEAARETIHGTLTEAEGSGGIIAIDRAGNIVAEHNTPRLSHGFIDSTGEMFIGFEDASPPEKP